MTNATQIEMTPDVADMAAELRTLASDAHQHESLMRARWGGDFDRATFLAAASIVECERDAHETNAVTEHWSTGDTCVVHASCSGTESGCRTERGTEPAAE